MERVKDRVHRVEATKEQRDAFLLAFRTDLEVTRIHNLLDRDKIEKATWGSSEKHIQGHASMSAALEGYEYANIGLWEWARTKFKLARSHSGNSFWGRSTTACEEISEDLRREPPIKPMDIGVIKDLYEDLGVTSSKIGEAMNAGAAAKTPLEFMKAWHMLGKHSLAFANIISDDILEMAQAGKWEELLTFNVRMHRNSAGDIGMFGYHKAYKVLEHTPIEDNEHQVMVTGVILPGTDDEKKKKSVLGKHAATIEDADAQANINRVWNHVFWGAGWFPDLRGSNYGRWDAHQQEDGLWYLETYKIPRIHDQEAPGGYRTGDRVWEKNFSKELPDGYKSREDALYAAWQHAIYKK